MKIYIAGKVTGEPRKACEAKFQKAAEDLKKSFDCEQIVNPMRVVKDPEAAWKTAMIKCFSVLLYCDAIYLLNDWKDSKGARIEYEIAREIGLKIFFESNGNTIKNESK